MTKQAALGSAFYVGTRDVSGDIGALTSMEIRQALQNVSSIEEEGTERLGLRLDGSMAYTSFWNPSANRAVAVLSVLGGPSQCTYVGPGGSAIGRYALSLEALIAKFSTANGQDGSLSANGQAMGSQGRPPEWGRLLTLGKQTFASSQEVAAWEALTDYSLDDLVQPTVPNGHFYKVTVDAGSSDAAEPVAWPTNGTDVVDDGITWTDQGLLPNGLDRGAGSASNFGMAAYLHAFSLGSGAADVVLQDSADRVAWDDIPGTAFTSITGATTERVVTAPTENVRRYVRAYVTGVFTDLVAIVNAVVYRQIGPIA
jgi:hypothetical protein